MNPINNPYTPGAGTPPPELAGRNDLRETVRVAVERVRQRRPAKSILMIGLRGVGKTVLLERMREDAEASGIHTLKAEAPENRSLPALLAPQLRLALLRLSRNEKAKDLAIKGLRTLAGFVEGLKVKYKDIEISLDYEPDPGLADNGDLELDLQTMIASVGEAALCAGTALIFFVDELQYVEDVELAALIVALHQAAQRRLPVGMVGAGLPQLRGRTGRAKSYAERLFDFSPVGSLSREHAELALTKPAADEGVGFQPAALNRIIDGTKCYPYFIQEWGKHAWDEATASPITEKDIVGAEVRAIASLDEGFFRVRFDRLTPAEKRYLRAMAELGPGPHRSGDVANVLDRKVTSLSPVHNRLIAKGMIWSPSHGDTAFTVPLFDEFMRRTMPGDDWKAS